jgi:hypothetical protein
VPRDISSPVLAAITSNLVRPGLLADIEFHSQTVHCWSGPCPVAWNGNTYTGTGSFGKIGTIAGGTTVSASGTSIALSGIDPVLMGECLADIQLGAPVTLWLACFDQNLNVLGTPYALFVGTVDQPVLDISLEELAITLKLENRLVNLQRATLRRYTANDQNLYYPTDCAFNWVEILSDQALLFAP